MFVCFLFKGMRKYSAVVQSIHGLLCFYFYFIDVWKSRKHGQSVTDVNNKAGIIMWHKCLWRHEPTFFLQNNMAAPWNVQAESKRTRDAYILTEELQETSRWKAVHMQFPPCQVFASFPLKPKKSLAGKPLQRPFSLSQALCRLCSSLAPPSAPHPSWTQNCKLIASPL